MLLISRKFFLLGFEASEDFVFFFFPNFNVRDKKKKKEKKKKMVAELTKGGINKR